MLKDLTERLSPTCSTTAPRLPELKKKHWRLRKVPRAGAIRRRLDQRLHQWRGGRTERRPVDLRPDHFQWFGQCIIVGSTYHYLPVDDEIPDWRRTTVDVLMAVAGAVGGIAQLLKTTRPVQPECLHALCDEVHSLLNRTSHLALAQR